MQQGAPLMQARSIGLASRAPDAHVLPTLVGQLNNEDPVVRLAAHEELRRRTGQDFGYVPWAPLEERSHAVTRWRAWVGQDSLVTAQMPKSPVAAAAPSKSLPGGVELIPTSRSTRAMAHGFDGSKPPPEAEHAEHEFRS
jgi:hypothetical protein